MNAVTYSRLGVNGRFGNQLWQIAGTIAVGYQHDYEIRFPPWEYAAWFNLPQGWFQGAAGFEATQLANVPEAARDYLQHYPLIEPYATLIRELFQPHLSVNLMMLDEQYDPATAAAVHVRRGDYAETWRGHGMLPREYYLDNWPDGRVLVFSDDPAWCAANLPGEIVHIDPLVDFLLMQQCREFLISNSSFSWWAAWLADKPTAYPAPWFTRLATGDMHVPGWRPIDRGNKDVD